MKILVHEDMMNAIGDDIEILFSILDCEGFSPYSPIFIYPLNGVGTFFEQYEFCYN
jgi:hypothetical protein